MNFPVAGAIKDLKTAGPYLILKYAKWLASNFGVIWAFAIMGVIITTQDVPMPCSTWMTRFGEKLESWRDRVKRSMPPAVIAWLEIVAWTVFVLGVTVISYFFFA